MILVRGFIARIEECSDNITTSCYLHSRSGGQGIDSTRDIASTDIKCPWAGTCHGHRTAGRNRTSGGGGGTRCYCIGISHAGPHAPGPVQGHIRGRVRARQHQRRRRGIDGGHRGHGPHQVGSGQGDGPGIGIAGSRGSQGSENITRRDTGKGLRPRAVVHRGRRRHPQPRPSRPCGQAVPVGPVARFTVHPMGPTCAPESMDPTPIQNLCPKPTHPTPIQNPCT